MKVQESEPDAKEADESLLERLTEATAKKGGPEKDYDTKENFIFTHLFSINSNTVPNYSRRT